MTTPVLSSRAAAAALFVLGFSTLPAPARAQSITTTVVNQTSCIQGSPGVNCINGGSLQTLTVDCTGSAQTVSPFGKLSTALAAITDRNGPNTINISGTCNAESVAIIGFNRLTIAGPATLSRPSGAVLSVVNSRNVVLNGLTISGGAGLAISASGVGLRGITVQGAGGIGVSVDGGSNVNVNPTTPTRTTAAW